MEGEGREKMPLICFSPVSADAVTPSFPTKELVLLGVSITARSLAWGLSRMSLRQEGPGAENATGSPEQKTRNLGQLKCLPLICR